MNTYTATVQVDNGKTIRMECDRFRADALEEVTKTVRGAIERLCSARGWNVLWDSFNIEVGDIRVRA